MKATLFFAMITGLFLGQGCTRKAAVDGNIVLNGTGGSVSIKHNHTVSVVAADAKINVLFKSVKNDSRCPKGAECVWAGTAWIILQVNNYGETVELELKKPKTVQLSNNQYVFELTELTPYPDAGKTINPGDYIATIKVTYR